MLSVAKSTELIGFKSAHKIYGIYEGDTRIKFELIIFWNFGNPLLINSLTIN
jgi:hypothetical protein